MNATICAGCGNHFYSYPTCDCIKLADHEPYPERSHLLAAGYTFDATSREWSKCIANEVRKAKRDHKDGRIKAGQSYRIRVWRVVRDESGEQYHERSKAVVR